MLYIDTHKGNCVQGSDMRRFSIFAFMFVVVGVFIGAGILPEQKTVQQIIQLSDTKIVGIDPLDNMPIVHGGYGDLLFNYAAPVEQRESEFRRWLSASVKISVSGASGSGTICYYDQSKNLAYIASCGHLWNSGTMSAEEGLRRNITCKIIVWYQNEEKLSSIKEYPAKLIFYSYRSGCDTSLLTFQPDWAPSYFPIASLDYKIPVGSHQHSCGCDGGREVAHYDVVIVGPEGNDLVTKYNSPRPGRSGGGLMSDDGYYIGTCWGTSSMDGSGVGYFTPINAIHQYWNQQKGYEFLLNQPPYCGAAARQLPIINRNGPLVDFPRDYIPLPGSRY
jgi:hypothetical protein